MKNIRTSLNFSVDRVEFEDVKNSRFKSANTFPVTTCNTLVTQALHTPTKSDKIPNRNKETVTLPFLRTNAMITIAAPMVINMIQAKILPSRVNTIS